MRETREPTHFESRPTDDVGEQVGVLWVIEDRIKATTTITEGTTLREFLPGVPKDDAIARGYGDYLLTRSAGKADGYLGYYFAKPKTEAQSQQQPYRSTPRTMEITWPAWLRSLYGGIATRTLDSESGTNSSGATTNTKTRTEFQDRYELIPRLRYRTAVVVEEFLSPTQWQRLSKDEGPVETLVRYFYKGTQFSMECIHDDVLVPEDYTSFTRDQVFGMRNSAELPDGQLFPATNWLGWKSGWVLSDDQEFIDGLWKRTRIRVTEIPPLPRALRFG